MEKVYRNNTVQPHRPTLLQAVGLSICCGLGWVGASVLMSRLPLPPGAGSLLAHLSALLVLFAYLLLASLMCRQIITLVCAAGAKHIVYLPIGCTLLIWLWLYWNGHLRQPGFWGSVAGSANLLVFASLFGAALSSAIKRMAELVPICVTAAAADITSVYGGPTKDIAASLGHYYEQGMAGAPPLADFIVIKAVLPGYQIPVPLFGLTDWIFLALLSAAMLRLGKDDNILPARGGGAGTLYLPPAACGLYISILAAQITGLFLPALPTIALSFLLFALISCGRLPQLTRSDALLTLFFPLAVTATILLVYRQA